MELLLIDPASAFSKHIESLKKTFSVTLISDLKEALSTLKKKKYPPVLVVFKSLGEKEVSFFNSLQETKKKHPFCLSLLTADTKQGFALTCDYLVTSWEKEDIDLLISLLNQEFNAPPSEDASMDEIYANYHRSIFEKIRTIHSLLLPFEKKGTIEAVQELKNAVHKLAGNAGTYGYPKVTTVCKEWEGNLNKILEKPQLVSTELPSKDKRAALLQAIKLGFAQGEIEAQAPTPAPSTPATPSKGLDVCVIDDDVDLLALIENAAKKQGLSIQTEADFKRGEQLLKDPSFNPKVLLLDLSFPDTKLTGFDLLRTFNTRDPRPMGTIVGILSVKGEITQRVQASGEKADLYFQKPLSPNQLIEHLQKLKELSITKKTNVLLIDDDLSFCTLMETALKSSVYNLKFFTEATNLFQEIEAFSPELLLLDVHLVNQSGIDVLRSLHTDYRFRSIPVIIISVEKNIEVINEALLEGAAGYLFKPITPDYLKQFLDQFFRKQECRNIIYNKDTTLEVFTKQTLLETFSTLRIKFSRFPIATFHCLFPENVSNAQKEAFNKKLAQILLSYFGKKDVVGTWDKEFFVLFITDFTLLQLRTLLSTLFDQLQKEKALDDAPIFSTLVSYPPNGRELEQLIQASQNLISEAKEILPWSILLKEPSLEYKQEDLRGFRTLLVCSDPVLCNILQYALELKGVSANIITRGDEAYKWLAKHFLKEGPDLIILDSDLSNEDPMIVLDRFKNLVGNRIPIIMLSSLVKEGDITEGLRRGASNYIIKPFSLNIFMQTFEQTLR